MRTGRPPLPPDRRLIPVTVSLSPPDIAALARWATRRNVTSGEAARIIIRQTVVDSSLRTLDFESERT